MHKYKFKSTGELLRAARISMNFSQSDLSEIIRIHLGEKVHSQFVSNWERGLCHPPEHYLLKLLDLMRINKQEYLSRMVNDFIEEKSTALKISKAKPFPSKRSQSGMKFLKAA